MSANKPCYWCGNYFPHHALTRDHLIPQWALTTYPELKDGHNNLVRSCRKCNGAKAGMPPAVFAEARNNPTQLRLRNRQWQNIQQTITNRWYATDNKDRETVNFKAYVLEQMKRPINHVPPKGSEVWSSAYDFDKLVPDWEAVRQRRVMEAAIKAGVVNMPHSKNPPLNRLYTYETLNDNLGGSNAPVHLSTSGEGPSVSGGLSGGASEHRVAETNSHDHGPALRDRDQQVPEIVSNAGIWWRGLGYLAGLRSVVGRLGGWLRF